MKNKMMMTVGLCSLLVMGACSETEMYLLVGSYATPEEEGIKVYRFNEESGEATYLSGLTGISNPSYLTPSSDGSRIYAVGEDGGDTSAAHALAFDKEKGTLALLNTQLTDGGAPCYIALSPSERFVLTANYLGGSVSVFPLAEDGRLRAEKQVISFTGNGADQERQKQPHLHCTVFTPDGKHLLAMDLGTDRIHTFPIDEAKVDVENPMLLNPLQQRDVQVAPGSGPRHLDFHPNGRFAYLMNELSGKVDVFSYSNGQLKPLQSIEADTVGARGSADIHVSPDGKFVYASNRLQADGIAIFAIDEETGLLTKVGYQLTGIHPRNFILTPNGRYLLVACRDSHVIQIFERDALTGLLKDTGRSIAAQRSVCLKFIVR